MFRQVGIGASAVLAVGLLAAGCSDDGDTVIFGGGSTGDLNNNDNFPATSVASNNLASDNGGLSPNGGNVQEFEVKFNCDCCDSDGVFAGDNSALVLFRTQDAAGAGNDERVYATYYDGNSLTPPIELQGDDRNENVAVDLSSYVMIPLNTKDYQQGVTNTATQAARANAGNWLILGEYTTLFNDPARGASQTGNVRGRRHVLASWVFLKDLKSKPVDVNNRVGGVTQTFRYGFQQTGTIVSAALTAGGHLAGTDTNAEPAPAGFAASAGSPLSVPPEHVTSYGALSDTFCGQTCFGGTALPFSAARGIGTQGSDAGLNAEIAAGRIAQNSRDVTAFTQAIPTVSYTNGDPMATNPANLAPYSDPQYDVGERTTYVRAFWTQIANSRGGGGTFRSNEAQAAGDNNQSYAGGHELQLRHRGFNLATLTWENDEAQLVPPVERNGNTTALRAGTAPFPTFYTYNNLLFYKYADASLVTNTGGDIGNTTGHNTREFLLSLTQDTAVIDWQQRETGGHNGGNIVPGAGDPGFWEEIIAVASFQDDGDGTNSLVGSSHRDLSSDTNTRTGTANHTVDNPTVKGLVGFDGADLYPADREMANFEDPDSIYGADEGLGDVTIFYTMADNSNTTGNVNIDREALAAVINANTTAFVGTGTNPVRFSGPHAGDFHGTSDPAINAASGAQNFDGRAGATNVLIDPVVGTAQNGAHGLNATSQTFAVGGSPDFMSLCINRTGTWIAAAFLRNTGTSVNATTNAGSWHTALFTRVYQPFRAVVSTTGSTTGTQANAEARWAPALTAQPTEVNTTIATAVPPSGTGVVGASQERSTYFGRIQNPRNGAAGMFLAPGTLNEHNWDSLPVNNYAWQGCLGYRCGFQQDANKIVIFYEQSDSTEDRVFARQFTITTPAAGTPTLTPTAAPAERESTDSVPGHTNVLQVAGNALNISIAGAKSSFRNIDQTGFTFESCDGGAVAPVVMYYEKIVDNTALTGGDLGDSALFAQTFNGTTWGTAQQIGRGVHENANVPALSAAVMNTIIGTFVASDPANNATTTNSANSNANLATYGASIDDLVAVQRDANISQKANLGTSAHYVYLRDREGERVTSGTNAVTITGNVSSLLGLYTRKLETGSQTTVQNPTFATRFVPSVEGAGATATTYREPTRLDHETGISDDASAPFETCQRGTAVLVMWEQDDHVWAQTSSDGVKYQESNGTPNPYLVDNDHSQDVIQFELTCCTDANGDAQDAIFLFSKLDRDGGTDRRLHARTAVRVQ